MNDTSEKSKMLRHKLCIICPAVVVSLTLSWIAVAQEGTPKFKLSAEPLSADQVAVYRAVLKDYLRNSKSSINLANKTEALELSDPIFDNSCIKGLKLEAATDPTPVVHQLESSVALEMRVVLVDPDRQIELVKKGDPQNLIKDGIDGGEKVSKKQLDDSIEQAFKNGIFTVSEIAFDKDHRHAVMSYGFTCGMLCGNGNTVVLKRAGKKWKVSKRCGGWVS